MDAQEGMLWLQSEMNIADAGWRESGILAPARLRAAAFLQVASAAYRARREARSGPRRSQMHRGRPRIWQHDVEDPDVGRIRIDG